MVWLRNKIFFKNYTFLHASRGIVVMLYKNRESVSVATCIPKPSAVIGGEACYLKLSSHTSQCV